MTRSLVSARQAYGQQVAQASGGVDLRVGQALAGVPSATANLNPWTEAKVFVQLPVQSVGLPARQGPAAAAAVLCQNVQSAGARGSGR